MDSYTLFGHIVGIVGSNACQKAHIELQALGVLPECTLENNPPLQHEDADRRAALSLWCGLAIDPAAKFGSKQFFVQLGAGKGRVPMNTEGESFIDLLAEVLRRGPEALGVEQVYMSHVVTSFDGFNGRAQVHYNNGFADNYTVGNVYPATHTKGVTLDFKQLRSMHEDLVNTPRTWPNQEPTAVSRLRFKNGAILID